VKTRKLRSHIDMCWQANSSHFPCTARTVTQTPALQ